LLRAKGAIDTAKALLDAGVDVNQAKIGDNTTPSPRR
jgi:hypothetical protein